jgi:hypothetical protein
MNVMARAKGELSSGLTFSQPVQSVMRQELNLCLMLELFDERLTRFERSLTGDRANCDFGAYAEAMAFLDATYLFSRMLLDCAVGVVTHRDLDKSEKGRALPKSFGEMYKRSVKGELPSRLNTVFLECKTWFPGLKDRRDAIVHHYETYFIVFGQNSKGEKTARQFSPIGGSQVAREEDLRSYIGMVMAGYQTFVDGLLDYWDEMFARWYGMSVFRDSTTLVGRRGNILWWAYRYGGYRNDSLLINES